MARADDVSAVMRYSFADRSFAANSFSTATHPSADEHSTQIRIAGESELGEDFFARYDLRYGFAYRSGLTNGATVVERSNGLEDQDVGLGYRLGKIDGFSHTVRVGVVMPGSPHSKTPSLSSGQWAIEPMYRVSVSPGFGDINIALDVGSRVFVDGGSAQFRSHLEVRAPITERLQLSGEITFRRSMLFSAYDAPRDSGELSNILRPGIEAQYDLSNGLASVVAYQVYVAGMGGHAAQRVTLGLAYRY